MPQTNLKEVTFSNPRLQRIAAFAGPERESKPTHRFLTELLAFLVLIAGLAAGVLLLYLSPDDDALASFVLKIVSLVIIGLSFRTFIYLRWRAKRFTPRTLEKLSNDSRDPILYLRAFTEDSEANYSRRDLKTNEEVLISALEDLGPVLSIGLPGEKVAPLGSTRIYFKDDEWQANVLYLMSISQFVLIEAGISGGLKWEIATTTKTIHHERLIFSFLSWHDLDEQTRQRLYESFYANVKTDSKFPLPGAIGGADFMFYDQNRNPVPAYINSFSKFVGSIPSLVLFSEIYLSSHAIRQTLRPFLKKFGF